MNDSDEEDTPSGINLTVARKFAPRLIGAVVANCVGEMFTSVGDALDTVAMAIIADEKWRHQNANLGKAIESLTDVTPFQ